MFDLSLDKHHLTLSFSLSSSLYIVYITGYGASQTSVDSGYFGVLVIWASILTRYLLAFYFIDSLHVFIYFMSYIFYCFLTMRGRPFVVVDF